MSGTKDEWTVDREAVVSEVKPREFNLHFLYGSCKVELTFDKAFILNEETIPVVERSAYLAEKARADKAEAEINRLTYELDKSRDSHVKKHQELEAENTRLREALKYCVKHHDQGNDSLLETSLCEDALHKTKGN